MRGNLRVSGKAALIKLRVTARGLPADARVDITDLMLQPGSSSSGWLPHTTELPWSAGMTFLNTSPGGDLVFWDDIEGKPVVFPPETHTHLWKDIANKPTEFPPAAHSHDAGEIKSGVFDPARIPVMDGAHIGDNAVAWSSLTAALRDLLGQYESTIAALQSEVGGSKLAYGSKNGSDAPRTYPDGYSTGLFRVVNGWPVAGGSSGFWTVVSFKASSYHASIVQYAYRYKIQGVSPLFRTAIDEDTWGPWGPIGG